jgi:hypothetical protein
MLITLSSKLFRNVSTKVKLNFQTHQIMLNNIPQNALLYYSF